MTVRVITVQTQPVYQDGSKGAVETRVFFDDGAGQKAAEAALDAAIDPFDDPPPTHLEREKNTHDVEGLPDTWWMAKLRAYVTALETEARRLLERDYQGLDDYQRGRIDSERKYKKKVAEELRGIFDLPAGSASDPPPAWKPEPEKPLAGIKDRAEHYEAGVADATGTIGARLDELLELARAAESRRLAAEAKERESVAAMLEHVKKMRRGTPVDGHENLLGDECAGEARRVDVNTPLGNLVTRVWAAEGFEPGTFEHYKGGTYTALGVAEMHASRWPFVVYYSHKHGSLSLRPLKPLVDAGDVTLLAASDYADAWLSPVAPEPEPVEEDQIRRTPMPRQRFMPVPGSPVLNLLHLVKYAAGQ